MAIPLSAIRKYTPEIIALSFVAIVLGAFWSVIDTYQPGYLLALRPDNLNNTENAINQSIAANITANRPIIEVDVKSPLTEVNVSPVANESENDYYALSAQKVIKFALTGE